MTGENVNYLEISSVLTPDDTISEHRLKQFTSVHTPLSLVINLYLAGRYFKKYFIL